MMSNTVQDQYTWILRNALYLKGTAHYQKDFHIQGHTDCPWYDSSITTMQNKPYCSITFKSIIKSLSNSIQPQLMPYVDTKATQIAKL